MVRKKLLRDPERCSAGSKQTLCGVRNVSPYDTDVKFARFTGFGVPDLIIFLCVSLVLVPLIWRKKLCVSLVLGPLIL